MNFESILICTAISAIFIAVKSYFEYKTKKRELVEANDTKIKEINDWYSEVEEWEAEVQIRENNLALTLGSIQQSIVNQQQALFEINEKNRNFQDLMKANEEIVKRNNVYLFAIQTQEIQMIDQLKKLAGMISGILYGDEDNYPKMQSYLYDINLSIVDMEQSFQNRFKLSTRDFKNRDKAKGTDFSLN